MSDSLFTSSPEDEREDERSEEQGLGAVYRDSDPRTPVAPGRVDVRERVHDERPRHQPGHVQVVEREQDCVGDPVAAAEGVLHPRQEQPAEEKLLAEHRVEEKEREDDAEPGPVPVHEVLTRVRADPRCEIAILRDGERRDESADRKQRSQRDHDQPQAASDPAVAGAPGRTEPEYVANHRPAEGALLVPDEADDEDELPDQAGRQEQEQRLDQRHVPGAGEAVLDGRSDDPGEDAHREGRRRPDREDLGEGVLLDACVAISLFGSSGTQTHSGRGDGRGGHGFHLFSSPIALQFKLTPPGRADIGDHPELAP